ncbi:MAG: fibronectin type III domain-containing protein, partial [Bacteroidota bacterium]
MFRFFFLCFYLVFGTGLIAQENGIYPVSATVQTLPPFQPNLADWADPLNNRIGVSLLLNDRREPGYQVQLRLRINGPNVEIVTRPDFVPTPIDLDFGVPRLLNTTELAEYFDLDNLVFNGISQQQYLDQNGLPEGVYTICLEAYDYLRDEDGAVSLPACGLINATLLTPPSITYPAFDDQVVDAIQPQMLPITWQANHTGLLATNYTIQIFEDDPTLSPEYIYSNTFPVVEEQTTNAPTAIIGPASAPLVLGTRYLLRVKAEDPSGAQQFQNGGFSELRYFVYGQACAPPTGIEIGNETHLSASLQWGFSSGAANYVVRLREQNDLANWYEFEENFNTLELENLTESTTYEVQIQSVCTAGAGPFGPTYTFSTNDLPFDPEEFDCGSDMADAPPVTNTEPLTQLVYGSQVRINEFYLKITTAERNDDGTWTGTGSIPVNWLGARVNCTFTELGINTDKEVFSGEVVAIDEGLESVEGFLTPEEISELLDTATVDFCGTLLNAVDSTTQDTTVQDTTGQVNSPPPAIDTTGTALPIDTTGISAGTTPPSDSLTQDTIGIITLDSIDNTISYDSLLTISGGTNLPIVAGVGTERIAFYDMTFTTGGATVSAYTSAKTPVGNKFIALGLEDFGFRPNGIQGEQKLQLSSNVSFDWSGKMRLTIKEGGGTYVAFDCFGVTEIGLDIDVELCRDLVVPVDPSTAEATEDGFVTASFTATASSWDEFAGEVSITPFEVPSLPGWTFTIEEAVLDFSETTTPPSVVFPEDYEHPDVLTPTVDNGAPGALNSGFGGGSQGGSQYGEDVENDGTINAGWTGFYLGLARVRVPEQFMASAGQDSTGVSQDSTYVGRDSSQALTIGAYQLIIDDTGFSGGVFATNVLTLNQGQAGGWDLSLDTVAIRIQSNQFESANLNGRIKVPALDGTLTYGCHIQPGGSYAFAIGVADTVSMSAMVASLDLYENTEIGVTYNEEEDDFDAYIILHGKATFRPKVGAQDSTATASTGVGGGGNAGAGGGTTAGQDSTSRFNLPSISFQDFHLSSTRPYLQNIGIWSLASEDDEPAGLKGFPIKINEIGMFQSEGEEDQVALGVDLTLNLKKDTEQGFGANGRLFVICDVKEDPETGKQTWKFNRVRLDRLAIDYVGAGFEFHGFIESFEDDETYGTGFNGGIQASFKPSISVGVVALFGKKDDYRYFFADAMVSFNPGINLGPSGMAIYGFGGGVSYHMQRVGFAGVTLPEQTVPPPDSTATTPVVDSTSIGSMAALQSAFNTGIDPNAAFPPAVPLPTSLGESLTGISYVPDEDIGIGIKATLAFGTVKREVFNGDLTFEIVFNSNGSMNYIGIAGNANFLTPPKTPDEPEPNPAVSAYVEMGYDFMNESFDALLRLRVYVAKGLIQGAYPDYVAGEGKIHASQEDWYIYLGEPETPISLSMDLSRLAKIGTRDDGEPDSGPNPLLAGQDSTSANQPLGSIGDVGLLLTAYLDAGSVLPDFPGIPDQLADRLPEPPDGWNPTNRDDPAFADAGGLLFGSGLHVSMPELKFLIFYASLNAGMGFDMMLKDYGPGAYCANMDDSP